MYEVINSGSVIKTGYPVVYIGSTVIYRDTNSEYPVDDVSSPPTRTAHTIENFNLNVAASGSIVYIDLPQGTRDLEFQARNDAEIHFSESSDFSAYLTMKENSAYYNKYDHGLYDYRMYFRANKATVIEIRTTK